ncbi:hypothetical protein L7F22_064008 [Adiantum nelumboides]|nr:hypothetical protein [Adiantum nelumboides]
MLQTLWQQSPLVGINQFQQVSQKDVFHPTHGSSETIRQKVPACEQLQSQHGYSWKCYNNQPCPWNHHQQQKQQPCPWNHHQQQKQQHKASKGSSATSRWAYLVAHISDPSRVVGRECRDAGQIPPREPCPTFKSFMSDGGKVEDLLILSLCKRILQRSKRQQLPQPLPSQLEALIPTETAEDSKDSGSCVTTEKHITPSMAVIQAVKVASSPPLQNKVLVPKQIPNAMVNENFSNLKILVLTFNDAKDETDTNSCSTTLVAAIESLDTTCSSDEPLQMDIPPNTTLSTSLQEDLTGPDKPMECLADFQPMVFTQQKTQVSLPIVSLEAKKDSIFSWTKLKVTINFDKGTNQVADMISFEFGKIIMVNNSAMTWDLTERALDAEALQQYISFSRSFYNYPGFYFKWEGMSRL